MPSQSTVTTEFARQLKGLDRAVFLPNVASQAGLRDQVLPAITISDVRVCHAFLLP
jgi:hypothetical protein